MRQEFVRFKPALLQIGVPLRLNVYELDRATRKPRLVWTLGHVFEPIDLIEVLNPFRRLLVLKDEQESALSELARESDLLDEETPYWCG